jgi:Protein of unknown function (DUF3017)
MEGTVELREPDPEPEPDIDPPLDDVPPESAEPEGRRYPSTLGGACYLLVLAASVVGLGIVVHGDWRLGVRCISAALGFGAVVRLVMPAQQAGMLAVRRRLVDVVILVCLALALWFLSTDIPNQPPL